MHGSVEHCPTFSPDTTSLPLISISLPLIDNVLMHPTKPVVGVPVADVIAPELGTPPRYVYCGRMLANVPGGVPLATG